MNFDKKIDSWLKEYRLFILEQLEDIKNYNCESCRHDCISMDKVRRLLRINNEKT